MSGFGEVPPGALQRAHSSESNNSSSKPQKPTERMPQTAGKPIGIITGDKQQNSHRSQSSLSSSSPPSMVPKQKATSGFVSRSPPSLPLKSKRSEQENSNRLSPKSLLGGAQGEKKKEKKLTASGYEGTTFRIGKPSLDGLAMPNKKVREDFGSSKRFSSEEKRVISKITSPSAGIESSSGMGGNPSMGGLASGSKDSAFSSVKKKVNSTSSSGAMEGKSRPSLDSDSISLHKKRKGSGEFAARDKSSSLNVDSKRTMNVSEPMEFEDDDSGKADEAARKNLVETTNGEQSRNDSSKISHEAGIDSNKNSGANARSQGRSRASSFGASDMMSEEAMSDRGERASIGADQTSVTGPDATTGRDKTGSNRDADTFGMSSFKESTMDSGAAGRLPNVGGNMNIKEPSSAMATTTSFLEALSEEERRVRTRHLPAVDGIRRLHKSEIKKDLALARSMNGSGNSSSGKSGKGRRGGSFNGAESSSDKDRMKKMDLKYDERRMDIDDEGTGASDEETTSDVSGGGGRVSNRSSGSDGTEVGPCDAFIPPKDDVLSFLSGGKTASTGDNNDSKGSPADGQVRPHPPYIVETITAFNPPRPKESIGSKKKHRLIRWERNPQVVEVELSNHRKTVQRVREELHNIERERERVEAIGSHLRVHFMNHLKAVREESTILNQELSSMQVDCVKAAELLTSKTRSRGMGKGSHVMRDVLSILKTRGTKLTPQQGTDTFSAMGSGGISQGHCWTLPGDKVSTPLGDGVVLHVFGPSAIDVNAPQPEGVSFKSKTTTNSATQGKRASAFSSFMHKAPLPMHPGTAHRHGFGGTASSVPSNQQRPVHSVPANAFNQNHANRPGNTPSGTGFAFVNREGNMPASRNSPMNLPGTQGNQLKDQTSCSSSFDKSKGPPKSNKQKLSLSHPRICVRTSFGIAYLSPSDVTSLEDSSTYTDQKLLSRWKKMVDCAKAMGSCVESDGMNNASCQTLGISSRMATSPTTHNQDNVLDKNARENWAAKEGSSMDLDVKDGATYNKDGIALHRVDDEVQKPLDEPSFPKDSIDDGAEKSGFDNGNKAGQHITRNGAKHRQIRNGVVPFGSGMLPTPGIYGAMLTTLPLDVLERNVDQTIMTGGGVLGKASNPCVPPVMKEWEGKRYDTYQLKGKVLQLRNELYRQRRIRILNERSCVAGKERSERVEGLLLEMKADLKSLKDRLQDELEELGIDQEKAEEMLGAHLNDNEFDDIEKQQHMSDDSINSSSGRQRGDDSMEGIIVTGGKYPDGDSRLMTDTSQLDQSSDLNLDHDGSRKSHKRSRTDGDSINSGLESGSKSKRSFRR